MHFRKVLWVILCLVLALCTISPASVCAKEDKHKVVRVGWYESAFHKTDEFGRRSGYGYEYQQKIAIYTGWTYEYVDGSWSELLEKLIAGEIDLLSDVSYTDERAQKILYSAEAMGSEGYHVFIAPDNTQIRPDDFSSLNGKRVGVNKNSIQESLFKEWARNHDVEPVIVESTEKTPVLLNMLANGEFDALVTLDTYGNSADVVPVWKVGFAESYFGVNMRRPDIKQELDIAMNRLFEENRDFNQQLTEKFNKSSSVSSFLTIEEKEWLNDHPTIRIGYRNNFLPFCAEDDNSHLLTGTLEDFISFAKTCEKNALLDFEAYSFATTDEALEALAKGEIDCVFPLGLSAYDGEKYGVIITDPLVSTEMYAVVRTAEHKGIERDRKMNVAVIKGNPNYETFIRDNFPNWQLYYYDDIESAFEAVASEEVYCALVSNYRINRVSDLCAKYELSTLATDSVMDMSFAVRKDDDCLYSILNKITRLIPETTINSSLTNFGFKEEKVTFAQFLKDNLVYFIATVSIITIVILLLVIKNIMIKAKAEEGRQIISEAECDPLTGLYNWNFYLIYANKLYHEDPSKPTDAIVINIDRFHAINALYGRDFGDQVLRELGDEIKAFLKENGGIASRSEADRFDIYCYNTTDRKPLLERFQTRMDNIADNANIHLRMGVHPWQEGMEPVSRFDRAGIACNKARSDYKSQIVVYDEEMDKNEECDQRLLNDLGRALENDELEVYYQPKYNIRNDKPVLASAEALVRWNHPELGLIFPGNFIPLFEQSGQISALDDYVWRKTAKQIAEWRKKYGITIPVSVNLSRVDVFDPSLPSTLDEIMEKNGLKHNEMKLEVTESAYTENADQLIQVINGLRTKGYEIEMDDFGSGFSSLNMLSSMPIDVLKMDIAFIRNIERNEKDFRLVELIIDIARYLKVPVIAEGVETENQLKLLKSAGCDIVQGYYFSKPLPVGEFENKILKEVVPGDGVKGS